MSLTSPSINLYIISLRKNCQQKTGEILCSKIQKQVHRDLVRVWHTRWGLSYSFQALRARSFSLWLHPVIREDWWVGKISQDQLRYCCSTFPFFCSCIVVFSAALVVEYHLPYPVYSFGSFYLTWIGVEWVSCLLWASSLIWCVLFPYSIALKNKTVSKYVKKFWILNTKFGVLISSLFMV